MHLGGAIFLEGKPAHSLGLWKVEEGVGKEPGVSVDRGQSHWLCGGVWEHSGSSLGKAVLPCSFLGTALWTVPAMGTPGSSQAC